MLRRVLAAISLLGVAGTASAEPLPLSDQQLDTVTAGVIIAANFERVQNGERGLFVTVTEFDPDTGDFSTRTFGRTIPIPDKPTFGFNVRITAR